MKPKALDDFDRKLIAKFIESNYEAFQMLVMENELDESEAEQILNKLTGE